MASRGESGPKLAWNGRAGVVDVVMGRSVGCGSGHSGPKRTERGRGGGRTHLRLGSTLHLRYICIYLWQLTSTGLKQKREPVSPHGPKQSSAAMTWSGLGFGLGFGFGLGSGLGLGLGLGLGR